jgi:hypothetical protein
MLYGLSYRQHGSIPPKEKRVGGGSALYLEGFSHLKKKKRYNLIFGTKIMILNNFRTVFMSILYFQIMETVSEGTIKKKQNTHTHIYRCF